MKAGQPVKDAKAGDLMITPPLLALALALDSGASPVLAGQACHGDWRDTFRSACASVALEAGHERELAALKKLRACFRRKATFLADIVRARSPGALLIAASEAALIERDDHTFPPGLSATEPETLSQSLRFLAARVSDAMLQERRVLVQTGFALAKSAAFMAVGIFAFACKRTVVE